MLLSAIVKDAFPSSFPLPASDRDIGSIVIDSRKATGDSCFVCLRGAQLDGHDYVSGAYANGCRVFLAEQPLDLPSDAVVLLMPDTRAFLPILASSFYRHPTRELSLIGITGTKGKTTTSLMVYRLLNDNGIPAGYIGSNGVRYSSVSYPTANTTPESLELQKIFRDMVSAGVRVCVLEVSSQALEHHRVDGLSFAATAFLNLSNDHIGPTEHPSFEAYAAAKRKLFTEHDSSRILVNADDPAARDMIQGCTAPVETFSLLSSADWSAENLKTQRRGNSFGTEFILHKKDQSQPAFLPMPGDFNVQNALCALALAFPWVPSLPALLHSLTRVETEGRFQPVPGPEGRLIFIDYAHNRTSMEHALSTLRPHVEGRLIVLYGSVGGRTENRRSELGSVASRLADFSVLTSDNPDREDPRKILREIAACYPDPSTYVMIPDRKEAIEYALDISRPGDCLLLAGKGHENYQLIQGVKEPFSEKAVIEDYLQRKKLS